MQRHFLFMLLLLFACGPLPALGEADLDRFAGQWRGMAIERNDDFEIAADNLVLQLEPSDRGFDLEWKTPGGGIDRVRFIATDQPEVFSASASKRGFLGLFSSSEEIDPLAGDPFAWARFEADSFIVYKLTIDDRGAFSLDRHQITPADDSLQLRFTRRAHSKPERVLVARLERLGGKH